MKNVYLLVIFGVIVLAVIVNAMSYKDELREQVEYCANVKLGIWPDYRDSFKSDCSNKRLKEIEIILQ